MDSNHHTPAYETGELPIALHAAIYRWGLRSSQVATQLRYHAPPAHWMDVALSVLTRPTSTDGAENCPSKGDRLPIPRALNSRYALETKKALSGKAAGLPCSTHRAICTRGRNRTCDLKRNFKTAFSCSKIYFFKPKC